MSVSRSIEAYQYEPLSEAKQEIRLLKFKNVPFHLNNYNQRNLECSIQAVSLTSRVPGYRTLSYVWGSDHRCEQLLVDGKIMYITVSLDIALRHLMLFQNLLAEPIWIDAICINQDDNAEKSWQVQKMMSIYLNAKSSIGWVGLPDEVSRLVMETVWEVQLYKEYAMVFNKRTVLDHLVERIAADIVFSPSPGSLKRHTALGLFLDRDFFCRVWIHQEVMVAKHLDLVCGTEIIDWDDLHVSKLSVGRHLGNALSTNPMDLINLASVLGSLADSSMPPKLFQLRFYFEDNPLAYTLWALVVLTRAGGAQCKDKRDAIYGVLSVARDTEKLRIVPNYDQSVEKCYVQTTKALLKSGHLEVLIACQQPRILEDLPTWAPDYSTRWDDEFQIVTPIEKMSKAAEEIFYGSLYNASKGFPPRIERFETRDGHELLCLEGVKYDVIEALAPIFTQAMFDTNSPDTCQDAILLQIANTRSLTRQHPTSRTIGDAGNIHKILRVLMRDLEFRAPGEGHVLHRLPPSRLQNTYVPYYSLLENLRPITAYPAQGFQPEYFALANMILQRNVNRRVFITSAGNLGVGRSTIMTEDVVAVIRGLEVPMILRPFAGELYRIVGEAYVDGIMDGEAMMCLDTTVLEIC